MVYQARPLSFSHKGSPGLPANGVIICPNVQFLFRGNLDEALDFSRLEGHPRLGCSGCIYRCVFELKVGSWEPDGSFSWGHWNMKQRSWLIPLSGCSNRQFFFVKFAAELGTMAGGSASSSKDSRQAGTGLRWHKGVSFGIFIRSLKHGFHYMNKVKKSNTKSFHPTNGFSKSYCKTSKSLWGEAPSWQPRVERRPRGGQWGTPWNTEAIYWEVWAKQRIRMDPIGKSIFKADWRQNTEMRFKWQTTVESARANKRATDGCGTWKHVTSLSYCTVSQVRSSRFLGAPKSYCNYVCINFHCVIQNRNSCCAAFVNAA